MKKNLVFKLKSIFFPSSKEGNKINVSQTVGEIPAVKKLGTLTSVEVMALAHAEPDLEVFPFHLYKGVVKGTVTYKGEIPFMKKVVYINHRYGDLHKQASIEAKYINRGWISEKEIQALVKQDFEIGTEEVPAIFIVAPKESRKKVVVVPRDPILLIKYSENEWSPVHSWDHSSMLNQKLVSLN